MMYGSSFFDFVREPPPERELPRRVYASLDSIEPEFRPNKPFRAYFESVDADWIDNGDLQRGNFSLDTWGSRVSIIEVPVHPTDPLGRFGLHGLLSEDQERQWFEFEFDSQTGTPINHFLNLFLPSILRNANIKTIGGSEGRKIDALITMDDYQDTAINTIKESLETVRGDTAMVYDVGQGNCNAICERGGAPTLYFDFGGGVLQNARTYPLGNSRFCFTNRPPIILSHWDWDHWSTSMRTAAAIPSKEATTATWIVPRQRIGAVHRTFLGHLNNVHVWPSTASHISLGSLSIYKCAGPGRNHSGLVATYKPEWARGEGILLPGDCDYSYLPEEIGTPCKFDAIVVPHHGGAARRRHEPPRPAASSKARLCLSYGEGNSFRHPNKATLNTHEEAGWAGKSIRETAARRLTSSGPRGHIILNPTLSLRSNSHFLPCGGDSCDLWPTQS